MGGHLLDHGLVEGARLGGGPDHHGWVHRLDHGQQVGQLVGVGKFAPLTGEWLLFVGQAFGIIEEQALLVDQVEVLLGVFRGQALANQFVVEHLGDPHPGGPGTKGQEGLVDQLLLGDVHGAEDPGEGDDPGPLDVIVEGQNLVLVLIEDPGRGPPTEVLKVEQALRVELFDLTDETVDEVEVFLATDPVVPFTEVVWVVQQLLVIGPGIDGNRQDLGRVDPGGGRVDHQLADRDVDPVNTPVTDAEDPLGVGNHDQADVPVTADVGQALLDPFRMLDGEIDGVLWPLVAFIVVFD